jgi:gliding motility-associated-like protein
MHHSALIFKSKLTCFVIFTFLFGVASQQVMAGGNETPNQKPSKEQIVNTLFELAAQDMAAADKEDVRHFTKEDLIAKYTFFGGDSLTLFDFEKAYQKALNVEHIHMPMEMHNFFMIEQTNFVKKKYNLTEFGSEPAHMRHNDPQNVIAAACNNLDFEDGDEWNFLPWVGSYGFNTNSNGLLNITNPNTIYTLGANAPTTACAFHTLIDASYPPDPYGFFTAPDPNVPGNNYCARLGGDWINLANFQCSNAPSSSYSSGEILEQTFLVSLSNALITYDYAVVLNDGTHQNGAQPYFHAEVFDSAGNSLSSCLEYYVQATNFQPPPGFQVCSFNSYVYYCDWTQNSINLTAYIGQTVKVRFTAAGCIYGGHWGYAYIDVNCGQVQILISNGNIPCTGTTTLIAPPAYGGSYSWTGPAGGIVGTTIDDTVTVQLGGTYSVTITPVNGCSYTLSTTVTASPPVNTTAAHANVTCNGASSGSIWATPSAGTGLYTYSWSPGGQTTQTVSGLPVGTYTVTVTDQNGCIATATTTIAQPPALGLTAARTNVTCYGGNNGTAWANANGGVPAYTYTWNTIPAQVGVTATNLIAGTYSVTVTDIYGCTRVTSVVVTQPSQLTGVTAATNVTCYGGNNGSIIATPSGGTGNYTYLWNPTSQTAQTAVSLLAGTYTVVVTDANNCTRLLTAVVTEPPQLNTGNAGVTNILCYGQNNGSAIVSANGGTAPYTYLWSPSGQTGITATSLSAGDYTCTVTDRNGCTKPQLFTVTQPPVLTASATNTEVSCFGILDGSASATAGGGTIPYAYLWTPSAQTGQTATNVGAGTYTVRVTDGNGCTQTTTTVVTEPTVLTALASPPTNVTCKGLSDGSAYVTAGGGSPTYVYLWTPSAQTGQTATNLSANTYVVSVTDSHGCTQTATVTITEPPAVTALASNTNVTCFGGTDGSVSVIAGGGTGSYSYLWTPSLQTGQSATNLGANTYIVVVTDANGCTQSSTATVTQPTAVTASTALTNVTCNGLSNGSAYVIPGGGTPGYTYLWSPSAQTGQTAANLPANNYTVLVSDSYGCTQTATVSITEPPILTAAASNTNVSCFGVLDGSATVLAGGGTGTYAYLWTPSSQTGQTATNLGANNYIVNVTDANGCTQTTTVTITEPPALTAVVSPPTNVTCFGFSNGSVSVTPGGGTTPYAYLWSPSSQTGQAANNLPASTYSVLVTDANGCTSIQTATITQPPLLTLSVNTPPVICISQSANIAATVAGGTPAYTYLWDNTITTASQDVSPVVTTTYTVNVTDANGCPVAAQTVTVNVNPPLNIAAIGPPGVCHGSPATLSANGGGGNGGPYTFTWSNGFVGNPNTINITQDTTLTVIVDDGCSPPIQTAVSVIDNPVPIVSFSPDSAKGCAPLSVNFADLSTAAPGSTYLWDLGDGSSANSTSFSHNYPNPGVYSISLTVTTPANCIASVTVPYVVEVFPLPDANFATSSEEVEQMAPTVSFANLSSDADLWEWDFGDGTTDISTYSPNHQYRDTGTYLIRLAVVNEHGCRDTVYGKIRVRPEWSIFIPNTFTPNGDGKNDGFTAFAYGLLDFDMWILDRWGAKIYHSEDINKPWNGTYLDNGNFCQNDVYVYKIKAHDVYGKMHTYIGHVTLWR